MSDHSNTYTGNFLRHVKHQAGNFVVLLIRTKMSRSALFVVDIQHELALDPKTRIPHAERICSAGEKILTSARGIIDSYRVAGQQSPSIIAIVQHEEEPEGGTLVRGTEPWKLVFEPRDGVKEELLIAKNDS